jgi:hypothetical protein
MKRPGVPVEWDWEATAIMPFTPATKHAGNFESLGFAEAKPFDLVVKPGLRQEPMRSGTNILSDS